MRKTTKSIISLVMSAAMVLTLGSGVTIFNGAKSASADEAAEKISTPFSLTLMQNNSGIFNWAGDVSEDQMTVATSEVIETTGEYSISAVAGDDIDGFEDVSGAIWITTDLTKIPTDFSVKPKTMVVKHPDGKEDVYDWSKAALYHNSMKETDEVRIGVVNHYVGTSSSKAEEYALANPFETNVNGTWTVNEPIPVIAEDEVIFNFAVTTEAPVVTPTPVPTATPTAPPAQKAYNAYLGFQTDNYSFHDPWDSEKYGINGKGDKTGKLDDYKTQVGYWDGDSLKKATAQFTNAEIKENNVTYTVAMSGVNLKTLKGADKDAKASTCFNSLFISTDIPVAMKGVTATASLKIDGQQIQTNVAVPANTEAKYYELYLCDLYYDTHKTEKAPYIKGKLLETLPASSIEITFTMKGVQFQGDFSTKTIGPAKNKTFTKGNFKYKVTTVATETAGKKKDGKVSVVGLSAKGKKAKKLSVPATVKNTGNYKVSTLGKSVFKGAKATQITLGKNIKKIPANAFANCKKLSKLTLKAKLSSVKKNAFKGCKKAIKVAGTSKKANLKKIAKVYKKAK